MEDIKFKEAVAGLMKDKNQRAALAQLLVEYIQPNHITTDFIGMLLNSRALNIGDALIKKVRKGIRVHTFVPGAIPLKSEITVSERINYVLDGSIVGAMANEWDLESGDIGTVESIRGEAMAKLRDHYLNKVYTALTTIWTAANTPSNYTAMGGAITATALENAIDGINQTTPGAKAIVGVRAALTPLTKFGAFWDNGAVSPTTVGVDSQLEEVMRTGWLGRYYGVPVIALNQVYNNPEDYTALLPTDKILILGENVGEFITYGPVRSKEWTDYEPTPPYWHFDMFQQYGMIIMNAQGIHVIGAIS